MLKKRSGTGDTYASVMRTCKDVSRRVHVMYIPNAQSELRL